MRDWNENGTYDSSDRYIDYKLSGGDCGDNSSGSGRGGNIGSGFIIWVIVAMVIVAICEPIGVLIVLGLIGYLIFN